MGVGQTKVTKLRINKSSGLKSLKIIQKLCRRKIEKKGAKETIKVLNLNKIKIIT